MTNGKRVFAARLLLVLLFCTTLAASAAETPTGPMIWERFRDLLQSGAIDSIPVEPYHESLRPAIAQYLTVIAENTDWSEWESPDEVFYVGEKVHLLRDLTFDGHTSTYVFTFVRHDDDSWAFQHLEAITIRFDDLSECPVDSFPILDEATTHWIREEDRISREIYFYTRLKERIGQDAARQAMLDGKGYLLKAQSWIPYVPVHQAFIYYLCWEEQRLHGSDIILQALSDTSAVVDLAPVYLALYDRAAHLKTQVERNEYLQLFE
ncbi:hypothetical protein GF324_12990, partial [bacterium]|nr:hypothetical protein [bacterium]